MDNNLCRQLGTPIQKPYCFYRRFRPWSLKLNALTQAGGQRRKLFHKGPNLGSPASKKKTVSQRAKLGLPCFWAHCCQSELDNVQLRQRRCSGTYGQIHPNAFVEDAVTIISEAMARPLALETSGPGGISEVSVVVTVVVVGVGTRTVVLPVTSTAPEKPVLTTALAMAWLVASKETVSISACFAMASCSLGMTTVKTASSSV